MSGDANVSNNTKEFFQVGHFANYLKKKKTVEHTKRKEKIT